MNEERRMILQMLKEGSISLEEAEQLLDAAAAPKETAIAPAPGRIRVLVVENGKKKVHVKVPFSLVRAGLKLGKSFGALGLRYDQNSPAAMEAMEILQDLDVDEIVASIGEGEIALPYTIVDIDDTDEEQPGTGTRVQVILE